MVVCCGDLVYKVLENKFSHVIKLQGVFFQIEEGQTRYYSSVSPEIRGFLTFARSIEILHPCTASSSIHFKPTFHFYTPWKHQKVSDFQMFIMGIERDQRHELSKGYQDCKYADVERLQSLAVYQSEFEPAVLLI